MPEPGRIFWSGRAQRFYQEGRRGAVSATEAADYLRYNPGASRFVDQRNQFVPNVSVAPRPVKVTQILGRDEAGQAFLRTEIQHQTISENVARSVLNARQVQMNEQIVVRDVITDGKGNIFTVETSTVLGGRTTIDKLVEQADRRDRGRAWQESKITSSRWKPSYLLSRVFQVMSIARPSLAR